MLSIFSSGMSKKNDIDSWTISAFSLKSKVGYYLTNILSILPSKSDGVFFVYLAIGSVYRLM